MMSKFLRQLCVGVLLAPLAAHAATPMLSAGSNGALFLNADGSVWGTGLVTGYITGATSPVRLLNLPGVVAVATHGADFAVLADGSVWGSGNFNSRGELGDGTTQARAAPAQVPGLANVKDIKAGNHALALKHDGTVWAWGPNENGQLGDGTRQDRYTPVQVHGLSNIIRISAAPLNSMALRADGTVWVWGGGAGDGTVPTIPADNVRLVPSQVQGLDQVTAISTGFSHKMAVRADGTVWSWGSGTDGQNGTGDLRNLFVPTQVPGLDDIVAVEARGTFSVALKADGTVWAWGINNVGQLGVDGIGNSATPHQVPGLADITAITAGAEYVVAMRRDGTVLSWGGNEHGQLGNGSLQSHADPTPILGPGGRGQLNLLQPAPANPNQLPTARIDVNPPSGRAPLTVTLRARNAADPDGSIRAYHWQSGDGQQATGESATFVYAQPGSYSVLLLLEDDAGGRGAAATRVVVTPSIASAAAEPRVRIANGLGMALANDGRILQWGPAFLALLSPGQPIPSTLPGSIPYANGITGATEFSGGSSGFVHVMLFDGSVLGWGWNVWGQVGTGDSSPMVWATTLSGLPPVRALASGNSHALALARDGRVFAWGRNAEGQLGLGDNEKRLRPTEIPGLTDVAAIAAGDHFSMALLADGTIWSWGDNCCYQLGDATQVSRNRPYQVPALSNVASIFAGGLNGFAVRADGTVWASGYLFRAISSPPSSPAAFRHVPLLDGFAQLSYGGGHIIGRKADGTVWTVGLRATGALGIAGSGDIEVPQQVPGISDAIWVAAGQSNSSVLRRDGTVLAWGGNDTGLVGDGTLATRATPVMVVNEMADGPLDILPEVPNTVSSGLFPSFFVVTSKTGELKSTSLSVDVKGPARSGQGAYAAGYNVYVAASVPVGSGLNWYQMDSGRNWSGLTSPMPEYLRGVALDSRTSVVTANILQSADLRGLVGTTLYIGYGLDTEEMLRNNRYRDIFTVPAQ